MVLGTSCWKFKLLYSDFLLLAHWRIPRSKSHFICSSSAVCTDARIVHRRHRRPTAGCTLSPLSFALLRAHKPHKGTFYLVSWKYLSYITCHFYPVTFQLLFSLEKVITRLLFKKTTSLRVRKASLFVTQHIWWCDSDQNKWSPDHIRGFVLFTYVFWCAVCGMPGVLLPEGTGAADGSFQAEIVLQRSCRNLRRKGREKMRLQVQLLQKRSTMCGATCRSTSGYTPLSFLHPFIHQRTSVKQTSSFCTLQRCFRFVFIKIPVHTPPAPSATFA